MKRISQMAAISLLVFAAQNVPAQQPGSPRNPAQSAPSPEEVDGQFAKMNEQMRLMQSQMEELGKTTDPKERQRLLDAHWSAMQQMMTTMHGGHMMHGPMMGGAMKWNDYRNLTPEQLRQRQYEMERWMPMQQMMMDQMMQHQRSMMMPPPPPPAKK